MARVRESGSPGAARQGILEQAGRRIPGGGRVEIDQKQRGREH